MSLSGLILDFGITIFVGGFLPILTFIGLRRSIKKYFQLKTANIISAVIVGAITIILLIMNFRSAFDTLVAIISHTDLLTQKVSTQDRSLSASQQRLYNTAEEIRRGIDVGKEDIAELIISFSTEEIAKFTNEQRNDWAVVQYKQALLRRAHREEISKTKDIESNGNGVVNNTGSMSGVTMNYGENGKAGERK